MRFPEAMSSCNGMYASSSEEDDRDMSYDASILDIDNIIGVTVSKMDLNDAAASAVEDEEKASSDKSIENIIISTDNSDPSDTMAANHADLVSNISFQEGTNKVGSGAVEIRLNNNKGVPPKKRFLCVENTQLKVEVDKKPLEKINLNEVARPFADVKFLPAIEEAFKELSEIMPINVKEEEPAVPFMTKAAMKGFPDKVEPAKVVVKKKMIRRGRKSQKQLQEKIKMNGDVSSKEAQASEKDSFCFWESMAGKMYKFDPFVVTKPKATSFEDALCAIDKKMEKPPEKKQAKEVEEKVVQKKKGKQDIIKEPVKNKDVEQGDKNEQGDSNIRRSKRLILKKPVEEEAFEIPAMCLPPIQPVKMPHLNIESDPESLKSFQSIKENIFAIERVISKETKSMICDCSLTKEEIARGENGCTNDCLNKLLFIECCNECSLGDKCGNKRFQKREYAKCAVIKTEKKGFGLQSLQFIPGGTFIMEYVGEVLGQKEFNRRVVEYAKKKNSHHYFMFLKSDSVIDATIKGNISRFINHSCEPNAETQKWTVEGELRIGFFSKKDIDPGEEITFDYQFQRYGKEAQKCYCEAPSCSGFIGRDPNDDEEDYEDDDEEVEEIEEEMVDNNKEAAEVRTIVRKAKGKKVKPPRIYQEPYMDWENLLDDICRKGLCNRHQTLSLNRMMVHVNELSVRLRILKVLQEGYGACQRLFLDYRGLYMIHTWMVEASQDGSSPILKIELLKTLLTLPVANKTVLVDSKVLSLVQEWSACKSKTCGSEDSVSSEEVISGEECEMTDLCGKLLRNWSTLHEAFRIPKKERVEQMKEHEREADQDTLKHFRYSPYKERSKYDRNRYGDKRKRGLSPPPYYRERDKRRPVPIPNENVPRLSKEEHRQLFEKMVAREAEEKVKREDRELTTKMEEEVTMMWQQHFPIFAQGQDPVPSLGLFGSNQAIPFLDTPQTPQQQTPFFPPPLGPPFVPNLPHTPDSAAFHHQMTPTHQQMFYSPAYQAVAAKVNLVNPADMKLPPKWKWAKDGAGRVYYYHCKERKPQWLPPPLEPMIVVVEEELEEEEEDSEVDSYEEDGEEDGTTSEGSELEVKEDVVVGKDVAVEKDVAVGKEVAVDMERQMTEDIAKNIAAMSKDFHSSDNEDNNEEGGRSNALVIEHIISPREKKDKREILKDKKRIRKLKEKFKRRKKEQRGKAKKATKGSGMGLESEMETGTATERAAKDAFRKGMATFVVSCLNPYRKSSCDSGRITNIKDFKHLARKLTLFVMLKELKHCQQATDLTCNSSVKHKAKEYIKKYMRKFGEVYIKSPEDAIK